MLSGWTSQNAKKFKEVYHKVLGAFPSTEPVDVELLHEFERQEPKKSDTGASHTTYESRTKEQLYHLAQEKNIEGRSSMSKEELIENLRNIR